MPLASCGRERSQRSSSAILSSRSKVFLKPHVSTGAVAASVDSTSCPRSATSCMKRAKKTAWRASSTCCVVRKYCCSGCGCGIDVGEEVVGDRVLPVVEQRVVPDRRATLVLGEDLPPVVVVLGEVELGGRPVAGLPALVQIPICDPVRC